MASSYGDLFAANLRAARARLNIPQTAVAARMQRLGFDNWDGARVSRCERNLLPVLSGELLGLAVALDTSLNELIGGNVAPDVIVEFPEPAYVLSGVNVRNSSFGWRDGATSWARDGVLSFVIPASVQSGLAHDMTNRLWADEGNPGWNRARIPNRRTDHMTADQPEVSRSA